MAKTLYCCRFLSIIYKRRYIRISMLVFFITVSVVLMLKLHHVTLKPSSLDETASMMVNDDPLRLSKHVNAHAQLTDSEAAETLKARERFANIGVKLVKESKVLRFHSHLLNNNNSDERSRESLNSVPLPQGTSNYWKNSMNESKAVENPSENLKTNYNNYSQASRNSGLVANSSSARTIPPPTDRKEEEKKEVENILLVILVISKPDNVLLRQAARKTWAKDAHYFGVLVRFVVGRLDGWDDIIDRESSMHSDMIVLEEPDTYETLPNKVLEGFRWTLRQRPSAPSFIMKADDDTIINLPYLVSELLPPAFNSTQILGAVCVNSTVVRDAGDKWAVSLLDFPFPTYPPYVSGGGYVMSSKCVNDLLEAKSRTVEWIHLEDVLITGILAMKSGISHVSHPGFSLLTSAKATPCDFVLRKRVTSVNHLEQDFFSMHEGIQDILRSGLPETFCLHDGVSDKNRTE